MRRSTRVGRLAGVPLEDLGVVPDERHFMTRDGLLKGNVDLIAHAAKLLAGRPAPALQIAPASPPPVTQIQVAATDVDRVDLHVDDWPVESVDITSSPIAIPCRNRSPRVGLWQRDIAPMCSSSAPALPFRSGIQTIAHVVAKQFGRLR